MGLTAHYAPSLTPDQELAQIVEFVTRYMRSADIPWNVAQEYPHVFLPKNLIYMKRKYSDQGELIAHALWQPLLIQTPRLNWKLARIGSVVTHPEYRRQGYSRKVMDECVDEARQQGCDMAVLWSDQTEFYTRLGFIPCGYEELFVIDHPLKNPISQNIQEQQVRVTQAVDPAAILRLYQQHTIRSIRCAEDIRKYLHIPGAQVWTLWSTANGHLLAYAVMGKGADFPQVIHEWGGRLPDLLYLVEQLRQSQPNGVVYWLIGAHSLQLIRTLQGQGFVGWERPLAWVKLLSCSRFAKKLQLLLLPQAHRFHPVELRRESSAIRLLWGDEWAYWPSEQDFLLHVLGSPTQQGRVESSARLAQLFEQVLPLEWWVWGWDSI